MAADPRPWPASMLAATAVASPAVPCAGSRPPTAPAPAAALAAAALASRHSDPAIHGRRVSRALLTKEATTSTTSTAPFAPAPLAAAASSLPPTSPAAPHSGSSTAPAEPHSNSSPAATRLHPELASPPLRHASTSSMMTTVGLNSGQPVSWASLADEDNEDDEEELALLTPPASKSPVPAAHPTGPCAGHEEETSGGWQEVLPRRGRCCQASPTPAFAPRPIPAWLHGRCCRCLAPGHRTAVCRDPLRCSRCLENGHWARGCCNPWRPLSSLACLGAPPLSRLSTEHYELQLLVGVR